MRAIALFTAIAIVAPGIAHADDDAVARKHFLRGEKLYALKKYADALDEYQLAFDASPEPDFLFNIAQCYRNLGNYEDAVFTYKRFLRDEPDAPNRDKVERLIDDLGDKIAKQNSEKLGVAPPPRTIEAPPPAPRPPPPAESQPIYKKWWFWTGVAVVGAGAGVGIYAATRGTSAPDATFTVVWPK